MVSNFYILGVLFFPNKEIPLIFLTNVFIYYAIVKRDFRVSAVIIPITYFFRDSYPVMLFLLLISISVLKYFKYKGPYLFVFIVFILFSLFSIKNIQSLGISPEYTIWIDRNVGLGEQSDSILSNVPSYIAYPARVFNHTFGSALRPQLMDVNDRIYFHGIGLWQLGVSIMIGLLSWLYSIRSFSKANKEVMLLAVTIILFLLFISFLNKRNYQKCDSRHLWAR